VTGHIYRSAGKQSLFLVCVTKAPCREVWWLCGRVDTAVCWRVGRATSCPLFARGKRARMQGKCSRLGYRQRSVRHARVLHFFMINYFSLTFCFLIAFCFLNDCFLPYFCFPLLLLSIPYLFCFVLVLLHFPFFFFVSFCLSLYFFSFIFSHYYSNQY
jgi:hypothetical protein